MVILYQTLYILFFSIDFEYKMEMNKNEQFMDNDVLLNVYMNYGGMPFTLELDGDEDVYQHLVDAYRAMLCGDLLKRYLINNPDLIEQLLEY